MLTRKSMDTPQHGPPQRPFPNAATFLGIAAALIVVWLMAGGLNEITGWPEPSHTIEAGASR